MQYPLISEYVKAIQDAGDNLDKLAYLTPVLDDHGEPYRSSGAFAVVFKMQDKRTGKYYALKCFTEEQEGRADAYRQIADELDMVDSPYITSVKYMEKELFVDSQCEKDEFPVLLMDWVEGETMETYIAANYHNQSAMSMLCYRFGKMAAWLRSQSFAHGDVKPDNIIIRPDGSLSLVDYDGMFVPSMKGCQSPTIGTKDFCHPLRTVDDFDETIDDFSLASIALSLKAISMNSSLLTTYSASDRLLFTENDYRNPASSKVISALQDLMCNKDFCTLYSLFMLALARKELSACSFRLFIGEKPNITSVMDEDLSTKPTEEELKEALIDERGAKYSKDGRKLLKVPGKLSGAYSVKEGTRVICNYAFWGCSSLSEIVFPDSVASIGDKAFWRCSSLKYISIPESVICLNGNPFMDWSGKLECLSPNFIYEDDVLFDMDKRKIISFRNRNEKSYVIPSSVTSIGDSAFYICSFLSGIVIPSSVTSIGDSAFSGCFLWKYISIPKSIIYLNGNPFADWNGKLECLSPNFIYEDDVLFDKDKSRIISFRNRNEKSYVIPSSVTSIGNNAFSGCRSLLDIVIPSSVTSIGDSAFYHCDSVSDIVFPSSVTSIGDSAFLLCRSLSKIVIPSSVTSIGNNAFSGCGSLSDIVIPSSVTSIGDGAFSDCVSLSYIAIPSSVTSISDSAFESCSSLSDIIIPSSVTSIGDSAFYHCDSLSDIVIPSSVTSIGDSAFSGCFSLKYISIPKSVICLNANPFADWNGKLECLSPNFIYEDDVLFDKDKSRIISFRNKNIESYVIPSSVTSIGNNAFSGCGSLSDIVIPSSVTSIGYSAFYHCDFLSKIVIPSSVTSIGNNAFSGCRSLSDIVIPSSVTSIGDGAFSDCFSLSYIAIPSSVTSIGDSVFYHCDTLSKIVIPSSVTSIGNNAFSDCRSLSDIVIPSSVTSIGDSAFSDCGSLSSIVIPPSVTSIGDRAFEGCVSLSSIVIPFGVTGIGDRTFCNCSSLSDIVIPSSVTSIGDWVFWRCNFPDDLRQELISRFGDKIFSSW